MSFGIGDSNKKPGIFDSFRAAMTPPELPPDDGQPIKPPTTVVVSTALALLAGLVVLLTGVGQILTVDSQLANAVDQYKANQQACIGPFGGYGPAAVIPPDASEEVKAQGATCQTLVELTPEMESSAKTAGIVYGAVFAVIGIATLAAGWFLRGGARWARLTVAGMVVVLVLLALVLQAQTIFTLGATLLLIIAVMLCYIGKGGVYFARLKARRSG